MTGHIRYELIGPSAHITLNRPEKKNALSLAMWQAIPELIDKAAHDEAVLSVILHGGEANTFAAGADISEFEENYKTKDQAARTSDIIAGGVQAVEDCPKPVIAAIEGVCVGGGVSLACAADLRIAGAGSKFGVTPGKLGILYNPADTRRLIRTVGVSAAKELLFTGRIITDREAKDMRLVDRLVAAGMALQVAQSLAGEMAALSQWSIRATKRMIRGLESGWDDHTAEAINLFLDGFSGEDFQEGYRAFLAKRKPDFPYR
ncbi:enoyl-CoA hydratase/isomerase family protein [Parvularcula lutaonensis]|uniref:Enoyl-CoA hydratase/isomerase family protein n=1 Tax=Parvularcula lutaonensis TaxID=491923 RepID=A0ABV7ME48_9PROT|nr:enoyl-CoA hydratase-related protein [Parvularcula lutaonensis]GGY38704.1 enoyl-CoA hydratase [Parvularcula lutaonensis]